MSSKVRHNADDTFTAAIEVNREQRKGKVDQATTFQIIGDAS
jgi:hypothetical protein